MGPSVFVSSAALEHNLRHLLANSGSGVAFPVIKANAYGHDSIQVAKLLAAKFSYAQVPMFCVARSSEAAVLVNLSIPQDILILSYVDWEWHLAHAHSDNLVWAITTREDLKAWKAHGVNVPSLRRAHLKINTGMNRLGLTPTQLQESMPLLKECIGLGLRLEGVLTHFWNSDSETDADCQNQMREFVRALSVLSAEKLLTKETWIHAENSAALRWNLTLPPEFSQWGRSAFRPGIHLWGYGLDSAYAKNDEISSALWPAFALGAPIKQLRRLHKGEGLSYGWRYRATKSPTYAVTIPLGYADGISRAFSWNGKDRSAGFFVIEGQKCPIISTVTMDMTMVEVSEALADKIKNSDQAVYAYWIHPEHQRIYDLSEQLGTITYEILCMISSRVPRVMIESMRSLP